MPRVIVQYRDARLPKHRWARGPWDQEPDKVQLLDEPTDLDALVVRGPFGSLNGYVGVPSEHPWWEYGYGACTNRPPCVSEPTDYEALAADPLTAKLAESMKVMEDMQVRRGTSHWTYCDHSPGSLLSVHGGITFSDHGMEASERTPAKWQEWVDAMNAHKADAAKFPKGDAAARWRDLGDLTAPGQAAAWAQWLVETGICHEPLPGRPERLWWFGFDCGHAWDLQPGLEATMRSIMPGREPPGRDQTYRPLRYVVGEIEALARQLADVWPGRKPKVERRVRLVDEAG